MKNWEWNGKNEVYFQTALGRETLKVTEDTGALIAAAPKLLSLLKYVLGCQRAFPDSIKMTPEFVAEIQAAIAKAEGRS